MSSKAKSISWDSPFRRRKNYFLVSGSPRRVKCRVLSSPNGVWTTRRLPPPPDSERHHVPPPPKFRCPAPQPAAVGLSPSYRWRRMPRQRIFSSRRRQAAANPPWRQKRSRRCVWSWRTTTTWRRIRRWNRFRSSKQSLPHSNSRILWISAAFSCASSWQLAAVPCNESEFASTTSMMTVKNNRREKKCFDITRGDQLRRVLN